MKIPVLIVLLQLFTASALPAQDFNIGDYLPCNNTYRDKQVKRVVFTDVKNDLKIIHDYDRKGRLIKLTEDEEADIATRYEYQAMGNKEICRVSRSLSPDTRELYILEYDNGRLTTLYRLQQSSKYGDSITNTDTRPTVYDSTHVLRIRIIYSSGRIVTRSTWARSAQPPDALLRSYAGLRYQHEDSITTEVHTTGEHNYRTSFDENGKILYADSVDYNAGRVTREVAYSGTVLTGLESWRQFSSVKKNTYSGDGYMQTGTVSYTSKGKRVYRKPYTIQVVLNEKGLETRQYDILQGKKVLNTIISYEYY